LFFVMANPLTPSTSSTSPLHAYSKGP
jgi:hypothetical protein